MGAKGWSGFPNLASNPVAKNLRRPRVEALFLPRAVRLFISCLGPVTFLGLERSSIGTKL